MVTKDDGEEEEAEESAGSADEDVEEEEEDEEEEEKVGTNKPYAHKKGKLATSIFSFFRTRFNNLRS